MRAYEHRSQYWLRWQASLPVHQRGLSARTINCLRNAGLPADFTPEHASQLKASELLRFPNFGLKSLAEIRKWLQHYGLDLQHVGDGPKPINPQYAEQCCEYLRRYGYTVQEPNPWDDRWAK